MVCQKLCCVTKWCVKDGVSKMVCERWCVTKWCVKWCVTNWCVKEGVSKMVGPSAPPEPAQCHKRHACHAKRKSATQNGVGCLQVPHLPRDTKVDVSKCHACPSKQRWMSPSATPVPRLPRKVPRRHRRPIPAQARHQSQPSAMCMKSRWM